MSARHQVILGRQVGVEFYLLERSGDTQFRNLVRRRFGNALAFEIDIAMLGAIKSVDAIQQTGLARAIGSNYSQHLSLFDIEGYID
jgi:hypothetical protein